MSDQFYYDDYIQHNPSYNIPVLPPAPAPAPAPAPKVQELSAEDVAEALKSARARGLPDGWTVKLDKRRRRKWIAPNGRSCDSIPKALVISKQIGLLPPDFPIDSPVASSSGGNNSKSTASSASSTGTTTKKKRGPGRPPNSSKSGHKGPGRPPKKKKTDGTLGGSSKKQKSTTTTNASTGTSTQKGRKSPPPPPLLPPPPKEPEEEEEEEEEEPDFDPGPESDPETSFDFVNCSRGADDNNKKEFSKLKTVHWDPNSPDGRKIGWRIRMWDSAGNNNEWREGRIIRYDPYSHKHKIQYDDECRTIDLDEIDDDNCIWIRLNTEIYQVATRIVWARVKGFSWWPAQVMESGRGGTLARINGLDDQIDNQREGYVNVDFFGSDQIAILRDTPDCIRPFVTNDDGDVVEDKVINKNKKKRNSKAATLAHEEQIKIKQVRNEAAKFYAKKAFNFVTNVLSSTKGKSGNNAPLNVLGRRVEIYRDDVNYPKGDTVVGKVRQYSPSSKKWLLSYEVSRETNNKYEPSWVSLTKNNHKVLSNDSSGNSISRKGAAKFEPSDPDLPPFLYGYVPIPKQSKGKDDDKKEDKRDGGHDTDGDTTDDYHMLKFLSEHCKGCIEPLRSSVLPSKPSIQCKICKGFYHPGCVDPPISLSTAQRMVDNNEDYICRGCRTCHGCEQNDVAFGVHVHPTPSSVDLSKILSACSNGEEGGGKLMLCSACVKAYENECFCPNCAHSWDDIKFKKIQRYLRWNSKVAVSGGGSSKKGRKRKHKGKRGRPRKKPRPEEEEANDEDNDGQRTSRGEQSSTPADPTEQVEVDPSEAQKDMSRFYPESQIWGYNEATMLICDNCNLWVHAGCADLRRDEYDKASSGDHPIYSVEFLCRVCCKSRCKEIIHELQKEDDMLLFALPVTEQVAPNYRDVIKNPMDLQTMSHRANRGHYLNYAWVREDFELMVSNALTFNTFHSKYWNEASRFYHDCMTRIFNTIGRAAPPGKYAKALEDNFAKAKRAKELEKERVQQDETTEKKDLVAGSDVSSVKLPPLCEPIDQESCVVFTDVKLKTVDAYYCAWMECCFTCGSSGAADTMLFCIDCGESFHSFCVNAPIHSMERSSVAGWRCPNCKVCEISGDVPQDEQMMLFCEMCDRAFSIDLLDPPLKAAPSGLFICAQCVDCKVCGNTAERNGVSLKYWSRDPQRCYRCGGCKGLIENYARQQCQVCTKVLRTGDDDLIECSNCNFRVHITCDIKAEEHLKIDSTTAKLAQNAAKERTDKKKYECPQCRKKHGGDLELGRAIRKELCDQAWLVILQGTLVPHANYSFLELHEKLVDEIDWRVRNMWREEYRAVVKEGFRFVEMAKEKLGSPKVINDRFAEGKIDLPNWMGQRAARFIRFTKRSTWPEDGFPKKEIVSLVLMAKLASSFMKVACRAMSMNSKKHVKCYARMVRLLRAPDSCGSVELPVDTVKIEGNRNIIQESEWRIKFEPKLKIALPGIPSKKSDSTTGGPSINNENKRPSGSSITSNEKFIIASPIQGWNNQINENDKIHKWKDPRTCCLCRTCGDDDAGFPPASTTSKDLETVEEEHENTTINNEPNIGRVGRLLPMGDGLWVHASCALWSSEVYEGSNDGLLHSVEKARSRGSQLKCFGCGRPGATLGCFKANCNSNYHFPCAKAQGAVFTTRQQMYCAAHKSHATNVTHCPTFEQMTTLKVATERKIGTASNDKDQVENENNTCLRIGALVVHSLGTINQTHDGFHSKDYITPEGYVATRVFWSFKTPKTRTLYIIKIDNTAQGRPTFSITPSDDPKSRITGRSAKEVYDSLVMRVKNANRDHYSQGDVFSKLPMLRNSRKPVYGLNAPQFFGFGLNTVRKAVENISGVEAVVAPLTDDSPSYRFCFTQPSMESITALQRKRAALAAEKALENASGCARTEGMCAVKRSGGSGRITRALVRNVEEDGPTDISSSTGGSGRGRGSTESSDNTVNQRKYREMKSVPLEQRLIARRSHIHGWGLFTKIDIPKHGMIIEYMGEVVRQCIADKREKSYEQSGIGSCYMFRLDLRRIVDATMIGCMARFMNHSCQSNAYAKVITVVDNSNTSSSTDGTGGNTDKKIVVFANRDIAAGEEITYDYKFPVEDGSLKCTCGAPNCIGRMN